jgi:hypothetical protein
MFIEYRYSLDDTFFPGIVIGIGNSFQASIAIEYRRYFRINNPDNLRLENDFPATKQVFI